MTKHNSERKRFIPMYTSQELFITGGSEGRKLEAGKETEGTEGCCLLAYSSGFLSHYLRRDGATHRDLGHQPSIINQHPTPTDLRKADLMKAFSSF